MTDDELLIMEILAHAKGSDGKYHFMRDQYDELVRKGVIAKPPVAHKPKVRRNPMRARK